VTNSVLVNVLSNPAFCARGGIGVAVLKYRLYEIDIVISKAVLYGSLAVFITAIYASTLVAGVGTRGLAGRTACCRAALAAAVVAVAFQPVRQWSGRLANRVVRQAGHPLPGAAEFAGRIGGAYAAGEVLPQMARIVAAGTGAEHVVVWLRVGDELRPGASSDGSLAAGPLPVDGQALPSLPDSDLGVPVMHQGVLLGAISIRMPKGEPLRPAGQQLVADVASQAGLVLANAGLIEDLRASRQRLVTAQDEARRRLERNIHDGAQQDRWPGQQVSARRDDRERRPDQSILGERATPGALETCVTRPNHPPLLATPGLPLRQRPGQQVGGAGGGRGRRDRVPRRTPRPYFCCPEALQNIAKYAQASRACIALQAQNGALCFTVSDDGTGYDARHTPLGSGLRNMADRLAALGGRLEVHSAPSQGTTITGHLPIPVPSGNQ
jgi:signal transduction histidine kinase